tara:strand:+ start:6100 stop:6312 length:213 start_codon:yes stop_codon:yes gene_type:complete
MSEKIRFIIFNIMGICSLFNILSNAIIIGFKGEVSFDGAFTLLLPMNALIAIFYSVWVGMQMEKRKSEKS